MAGFFKNFRRVAIAVTAVTGMASAHAEPTADVPAQNNQAAITTMAGMTERDVTDSDNARAVKFYKNSWDTYLQRRGSSEDLDKLMDACREEPEFCIAPMRKWVATVDVINMLPDNKLVRASAVNAMINAFTEYDVKKGTVLSVASNYLFHSGKDWLQTPQETLSQNANGVCGDLAALKYETLRRTGFSDDELRLVGGAVKGGGYHTVTMVNIDGKNMVLDLKTDPRAAGGFSADPPIVTDKAYANGYRVNQALLLDAVLGGFEPIVSFNDKGFHAYTGTLIKEPIQTVQNNALEADKSVDKDTRIRIMTRLQLAITPPTRNDKPVSSAQVQPGF